jgi:nicotinamidase-related amidase
MPNDLFVIIDPQYDFINERGLYARRHQGIGQIADARFQIIKLLGRIDKDQAVIVYSNYENNQFGNGLSLCIPGTEGHKIDLDVDNSFPLIAKRNHSCFTSDDFNTYLQTKKVSRIILSGFLAEYCVKQTALDGIHKGFHVVLLSDCIGTGDDVQSRKKQMLSELADKGAEVLDAQFFI